MYESHKVRKNSWTSLKEEVRCGVKKKNFDLHKLYSPIKASPFEMMLAQLKVINRRLNLDSGLAKILESPERELKVTVPMVADDESVEIFTGYRVEYSTARGPCITEMVHHPDIALDELKVLAAWTSWKCAVANLPCGGAMGAIKCDPAHLTEAEIARLNNAYLNRLSPFLIKGEDILISDFDHQGEGLVIIVEELIKQLDIEASHARLAIEGFNRRGFSTAVRLAEEGYKIIAIGNLTNGLYNRRGLSLDDLGNYLDIKTKSPSFRFSPEPDKQTSNKDLLSLDADLLLLTSPEGKITAEDAFHIRTKVLVEGWDGLITPEAEVILTERETQIIPDILANMDSVIYPYLIRREDKTSRYTSKAIEKDLLKTIQKSFRKVRTRSQKENTSLRTAALLIASEQIAEATRRRDILPHQVGIRNGKPVLNK